MISLTPAQMRERASLIRRSHAGAKRDADANLALLAEHNAARKAAEEVASIVSNAAQAAQMRFAGVVAGVVTEGLNTVYPDNPYEFRLEFRECAGKTVPDSVLYKGGERLDPLASTGNGVWDILAFTLRVSIVVLTETDGSLKFMAFDEPFLALHGKEKISRAYGLLEAVRARFGYTFLVARQH